MMNSNTRRTRSGNYMSDADISDEQVWSTISYLDPEQKDGPSNSALWVATVAALLIWGSLLFRLLSL